MDEETEKRFEAIEKRLDVLERGDSAFDTLPKKKMSIKEFILEKSPPDDVRRALCIARYLELYEGLNEFSSTDILEGFRNAKLSIPGNVMDKIQQIVRKGWAALSKEKGKFYVTTTGENVVEEGFKKSETKN